MFYDLILEKDDDASIIIIILHDYIWYIEVCTGAGFD